MDGVMWEYECGGCGRFYPSTFGNDCPFCYVEEFLADEADDKEEED